MGGTKRAKKSTLASVVKKASEDATKKKN